MTLTVGSRYRITWGSRLEWAKVLRIELADDGGSRITYGILCWWSWLFTPITDSGTEFVERIEDAKKMDEERVREAARWRTVKSAEVRYKGL